MLPKPGQVPIATQVLLQNLDNLVSHIDSAKLNTVISELGTGLQRPRPGRCRQLLDSGDQLLGRGPAVPAARRSS